MSQPAVALMERFDMDTDLPGRVSDAGPEDDGPRTYDEWLDEVIAAAREAQDTRRLRDVTVALDRVVEYAQNAREVWERS